MAVGTGTEVRRRAEPAGVRAATPRTNATTNAASTPIKSRPRVLVGVAVATWTAAFGVAPLIVVTLAAWVTAPHHEDAIRPAIVVALQGWLLAHHTTLAVRGGDVTILPLALTWLLGVLLVRGGRQATRLSGGHDLLDAVTSTFAVAVPYAVIAALLTAPASTPHVRADTLQALSGAFVLAVTCAGWGALRETGQLRPLINRIRSDVRMCMRAGLAASAVILAVSAVAVVLALGSHATRAGALTAQLHGGWSGTAIVSVLSMAFAPNAVAWTTGFATGPGFAVGAHTTVSALHVHIGAVPALPLLAPLPNSGRAPIASLLLLVAPIAAGLLAGRLIAPAKFARVIQLSLLSDVRPWSQRLRVADVRAGLAAGAMGGLVLAAAAWLSGGSIGPGRMHLAGPSPWQVGVAAALEIGVVAAATVAMRGVLSSRKR